MDGWMINTVWHSRLYVMENRLGSWHLIGPSDHGLCLVVVVIICFYFL